MQSQLTAAQRTTLQDAHNREEAQHPSSNGGARAVLQVVLVVQNRSKKIIKKQRTLNTDVRTCHPFSARVAVAAQNVSEVLWCATSLDCALCKNK
jgi:hypothetical protein